MKDYSLAVCKSNPNEFEIIPWSDLEKQMRRQKISEAIIFIIGDDNSEVNLAKRLILGQLILDKDDVKHLDEYCLVEHQNKNHQYACMVLLNPELKYALTKALEFRENTFIIQCVINEKDITMHVNKCGIVRHDGQLNLSVN